MNIEQLAESLFNTIIGKIRSAISPVEKRVAELEARQPEKGEPGPPGADAEPVEITHYDLLEAIKSDPAFLKDVVTDYLKENPPPSGKDGDDGADGIGLAGALINRDGNLLITMTNGEVKDLGPVAGKDGADLSDVEFGFDGERTITVKAKGGTVVRSYTMPTVIDRGYWRDGAVAEKGDAYTHDGHWWISQKDGNSNKPSLQANEYWRIGARKGRDGSNGKDGKDANPVKVGDK